jgi:hypothetical protein
MSDDDAGREEIEPVRIDDDEYLSDEFDDELRMLATQNVREMYGSAAALERRDGTVNVNEFIAGHLARSAVLIGRLAGEVERLSLEVDSMKRDRG